MTVDLPFHLDGFDSTIGLEITDVSVDEVLGRIAVEDRHRQPAGVVHGGVYAAIAESLASVGTYLAVAQDGFTAMGMSNQTSFLRPIAAGTIHGRAMRKHAGRTTWVWEVEMADDEGRLCALSRMTVAVRPPRDAG